MALAAGTRLGSFEILTWSAPAAWEKSIRPPTRGSIARWRSRSAPHWADDREHEAALRARSADGRGAQPSEHLRASRHRPPAALGHARCPDRLPRHGVSRRRDAGAATRSAARSRWTRRCEIGIAIADALDKAHRQSVTHRDLKPATCFSSAADIGPPIAKLLISGWQSSNARARSGPPARASVSAYRPKPHLTARAPSSARCSTWRRNSSRAARPTRGRTSSPSAAAARDDQRQEPSKARAACC